MKGINLAILSFVLLLVASSCEEDRTFIEFEDLEKGAYARELSLSGAFFLTDVSNSQFDGSVEFYDENQGQNVTDYNWEVQYIDKENGGADSAGPASILSIPSSSFSTNPETGLPSASFSFTLQEALDALGLTTDDVAGGSTFRFSATVVLNDGRTFTSANTGNNIVSSAAFDALFSFDADLLCTSDFAGKLDYSTEPWCGGDTATGETEIVESEEEGVYNVINPADPENPDAADFSFGAYDICYGPDSTRPGGDLQLKDACNILAPIGVSRWGEVYVFNSVTTDGPVLVIDWENDYGEAGVSTLTRQDGADWPPLRN